MARRTEKADALDQYIGNHIRQQRENLGLTQMQLADATGVSYQQIHKYERGINRISAGRLGLIADILHLPVGSFYEGFNASHGIANSASHIIAQDTRLCLEVARNFRQIVNPRYQEALHLLVRTLAS